MSDELYNRERARAETRLAHASADPRIRSIHEELQRAYLERADAIRHIVDPAR